MKSCLPKGDVEQIAEDKKDDERGSIENNLSRDSHICEIGIVAGIVSFGFAMREQRLTICSIQSVRGKRESVGWSAGRSG